ncbi:MAG: flagellar hook protein FlgE [Campylobacterales bacterium]|nr:flagellar hook protein FlgE [Campylobacterales bacterium]
MNQAYYSGISGVMTHQYGMDVVSDNLANVNTVGFKGSTAEFADLFTTVLSSAGGSTPTSNDLGVGSRLQATSLQMQTGSLMSTDRFSDLAIKGDGWFGVVSGPDTYYTRAGNFVFDTYQGTPGDPASSVSRLTTNDGKFVTGTMAGNYTYNGAFDYGDLAASGTSGAYLINNTAEAMSLGSVNAQGLLELPTRLVYPAEATTQAQFFGNIGGSAGPLVLSADVISPSSDVNRLRLSFTKSAVQPAEGITWDVTATVTSNDGSITYDTQNGQAVFDAAGRLSSFSIPSVNNDGGTVAIDPGIAYSGLTSAEAAPFTGSSTSDGLIQGFLVQYGVNQNGAIVAEFSNGRQSAIGQVAVYHFQNNQGLERAGDTLFRASANSGDPFFQTDAEGNPIAGATVYSGMLENSNVRLDVGLTDMIIMQRAYQANAKSITTADELIQKALQMRK